MFRTEAHRLAQEARDMALKAETKIEQHETECSRRYADLNDTLRAIRADQVSNAANTQAMVASVHTKVDSVGRWVGKIVFGVASTIILGLIFALWTVFSHKLGL